MRGPIVIVLSLLLASWAHADRGIVNVRSAHDVPHTLDRLEAALREKGVIIVARVNHAEAAKKVGIELRPTELLIFGNPRAGSPLMQCGQTIGLDLPQKALAWQDEQGGVWLSYNDQQDLARRHGLSGCDQPVSAMAAALASFVKAAVQP